MIYADHNATTPLAPEVHEAMASALGASFGNASSLHLAGQEARRLVERARAQVASLIGAQPDEIVFTSGGTEADNLAVLGAARALPADQRGVVTSTIEHQAVLAPCRYLRSLGHEVTFLSVDDQGRLDMGALAAAARGRGHEHDHGRHHEHDQDHEHDHGNAHDHGHGKVGLFTVMLANNETGVIQPVAGVVKEASAGGALVHTDAVQAAGKLPIDVAELGVSLLSLSSHKLHGPKGAGALYVRRGVDLAPLWHGGRQERGLRPGTENVAALVGFGQACELARTRLGVDAGRLGLLRARFESLLRARIPEARINGGGGSGAGTRGPGHPGDGRLPNTSSVSFAGLDGEAISINLDMLGVAVANGAACSAIDHAPSHVLVAMGQSEALARAAVRFSFGRDNTDADIDRIVELVAQVVTLLRGASA